MKIGVITFYTSRNSYGQILQCYALQSFLKMNGFSPFVVQFRQNTVTPEATQGIKKLMAVLLSGNWFAKSGFFSRLTDYLQRKKIARESAKFERAHLRDFDGFRNTHLTFSSPMPCDFEQFKAQFPQADAYIVGSDTVWGYPSKITYLDFLPDHVRRISYAPSFGGKISNSEDFFRQIRPMLAKFNAVSARETYGVEICKKAGRDDAVHVIDPTGLLSEEEYLKIAEDIPIDPTPSVFLYLLNFDTKKQVEYRSIAHLCRKDKLRLDINISDGLVPSWRHGMKGNFCFDTIPQWLARYRDAKYIITNSFHGAIFAVIFRKQFLLLPLRGRFAHYNERQYSLLQTTGLTDRIYSPDKGAFSEQLHAPISWEKSELILQEFISQSKDFLLQALTNRY